MKCRKLDSKNNIVWFGKSWDSTDFKYWINIPSIGGPRKDIDPTLVEPGEDVIIDGIIYPSKNITIDGETYILVFDKGSAINGKVYKNRPEEVPIEPVTQIRSMRAADPIPSRGLAFTSYGDGTCYVSGIGTCTDTDIVIPAQSPDGDVVKSIGAFAFASNTSLTSVIILPGIQRILINAFYNCNNLITITIPNTINDIGDKAFLNCENLRGVYITDLAAWCNISFYSSSSNPLDYAHNLYLNNELLTILTIPDGITSIKKVAFWECTCITEIVLPFGITTIENYAFRRASNVRTIIIPSSMRTIGAGSFMDCTGLKDIYYQGMESEWNTITKGSGWDSRTGDYILHFYSSIDQVGVFAYTTSAMSTSYSVDTEAVADSLTQRLSIIKGELWYQINYGLPLTDSYTSPAIFDMIIADIITSHPAVAALESFISQKTGHTYSFNGNIRTIFGDQISISNSYSV